MARTFVIHACLIFLTFCPGNGYRRRNVHNYRREFSPQKRTYFDLQKQAGEEYSEYFDQYDGNLKNENNGDSLVFINENKVKNKWYDDFRHLSKNTFNTTIKKPKNYISLIDESLSNTKNLVQSSSRAKWPKFDDILLQMGRRYDWKNDRWIKVKKKNINVEGIRNLTSVKFHEKHKFIYRIVKLNRPKSKRNTVLAVTAVR